MQIQNKKGKFIVIDGTGGCGKGTQINLLKEKFADRIHFTREPGGSNFAEKVRELMMSEDARGADGHTHFSLVWSGRRDHVHKTIKPKLEEGIHVISDRFDSSTWAYQLFAQQQKELEEVFHFVRDRFLSEMKPDLYILIDVDVDEGVKRMIARDPNKSHFHDRPRDYYERIREGYLDFAEKFGAKIIDGNKSVEEVHQDILNVLEDMLD